MDIAIYLYLNKSKQAQYVSNNVSNQFTSDPIKKPHYLSC